MVLLETKKVSISFTGIQILFDVDFQLNAGEILCLCGENGAVKSTLIKIFTGINSGYTGDVYINGELKKIVSPKDARELGIYAVQQHRDLVPTLNAVENMFMGNEIYKGKTKQVYDFARMRKEAREHIAKFGVEINLECAVSELKVSEQGIIAICKALVADSNILLIDEASAPLDDSERLVLYTTLQKLAQEGKGIVYITHHLDEVFRIGTSITVLRNGYKVASATIDEFDRTKLIATMTGNAKMYSRDLDDPDQMHTIGETVLEVEGLCNKELKDINLHVRKGEILGIAGLEGSGKEVIGKCCFGSEKHTKGKIILNGKEINPRSPIDAIKQNIGMVTNDRKNAGLVVCRSVTENTILTNINKYKKFIVSGLWSRRTAKRYVDELKVKCASIFQLVEYLSGGNQQKVLIAKWLEAEVDVLFMIEPTEGIDVGARSDLYAIFRKMAHDGKTLIIATSDIDELLALSDRIITMVEGRIVNEYDIDKADKQEILTDILSKHS